MPKQFVGSVDANIRSSSVEPYVNTEGTLGGLPAAAKLAAQVSTGLVLDSVKSGFEEDESRQDELYSQARKLKRGIYDAAVSGDEATINDFTTKLEDLKIAERQGAITGTNGQIRKESMLRTYINRYPHLEEQIRRQYSSTREAAQSAREQFKDPIEEGIDQLLTRSTAAGRSPAQQLDLENKIQDYTFKKQALEYKAALGVDIQDDMIEAFNPYVVVAHEGLQTFLSALVRSGAESGDLNAEMIAGRIDAAAGVAENAAYEEMISILRRSPHPDATMTPDFIKGQVGRIRKLYEDAKSSITGLDSLKLMSRQLEFSKQFGINQVAQYDPLLGLLMQVSPDSAGPFILNNWAPVKNAYVKGGLSRLKAQMDVAQGAPKVQLGLQMDYLNKWAKGPEAVADYKASIEGGPIETSGNATVDAVRVNTITNSTLQSDLPDDTKVKIAQSALSFEERMLSPGEYAPPSAAWYKDKDRITALNKPKFAISMTKTVNSYVAGFIEQNNDLNSLGQITYSVNAEAEAKYRDAPWRAYSNGGPVSLTTERIPTADNMPMNDKTRVDERNINDAYWIYRAMHGTREADTWVHNLLNERDYKIADLQQQENPDSAVEGSSTEIPTVDFTD